MHLRSCTAEQQQQAPRGAQARLSALRPCLRPAWPAHAPTPGRQGCCPREGRRQLREEQFPSPGGHATIAARDALGLLNLPSAAPHVPPFRPGLAKRSLTLPGQAGAAGPGSAPTPIREPRPRAAGGHQEEPWAQLPAAPPMAPASCGARDTPPSTPLAQPAPVLAAGVSGRLLHTAEKMKRWKTPGVGSRAGMEPRRLHATPGPAAP